MGERSLRGAYIGADDLPRPLRGPVPEDGGARRQQRRRYSLKHIGLDAETLPSILKQLVLEHHGSLEATDRRRLARALLARGLGAGQVGLVLNLLGDDPVSDEQLYAFVAEREREQRLSKNFGLLSVRRVYRTRHHTLQFLVRVQLDDRPDAYVLLKLLPSDVTNRARFRTACVRQASFVPMFEDEAPRTFERFANALLGMIPEDERA